MRILTVRNPATGEFVGEVPVAAAGDVEIAAAEARKSQKHWSELDFRARAAVLRRFHDLALDRTDDILDVIQSESGKSRRDAFTEVLTVVGTTRYYLANGARHLSVKLRDGAAPAITHAEVVYKPHGLIGLITPWNYPFLLAVGDAIPALLAGNAVLVKPSELTPLSANLARQLLIDAGLDPSLFIVLHGVGDVGAELIRHVDYVGFTGGTNTGRQVAVAAASRLIPFSLELGGKNPMIVLRDAPLDNAAAGLIAGAFSNTGQTCISVERVFVEDPVFDEFSRRVAARASAMKLGWSKAWDLDMGSLISEAHANKVQSHIDDATNLGAKILSGGRRRQDLGRSFIEPTVLVDVPESARAFAEETFGPVVALYRVRDADEAIRRANASEFGLNASVWSGDSAVSEKVAQRLETGSANVNSTLLIYNSFDTPMGGVKLSGIGRRHGEQGILRYTQAQSIVSSFASQGGYDAMISKLDRPSRVKLVVKLLKLWRKLPW